MAKFKSRKEETFIHVIGITFGATALFVTSIFTRFIFNTETRSHRD
jgi:hypothetical protein